MIIDLNALQDFSGRIAGTDRVELEDALGERVELGCDVEVSYNQTGGAYYFHLEVAATHETSCHVCLDPVTVPVVCAFDLVVRRGSDRAPAEEGAVEDYITIGAKEHEVHVHPFIHENLIVSIPMQIRCRDDCRGLCPVCGANRNRDACSCEPETDARWEGLRRLRSTSKER